MNGNPLTNVLTPYARKVLYALLFVASVAFSVWQASDGNWGTFVAGLFPALLGLVAASNTAVTPTVTPAFTQHVTVNSTADPQTVAAEVNRLSLDRAYQPEHRSPETLRKSKARDSGDPAVDRVVMGDLGDGCVAEHSPGTNFDCVMRRA